ncbi:hypothetical protein M3Y94_01280200 [Aphelenchoides besseyi]|nr:hypothetical protein M3Y94_01280200 [Aphelenchoides besseyi]
MNGTIGTFCVLLLLFSSASADDGNSSDFVIQLESALWSIMGEHVLSDVPTTFTNFSDALSTYRKDVHEVVLKSINNTEPSSTMNAFGQLLTRIEEFMNITNFYDEDFIRLVGVVPIYEYIEIFPDLFVKNDANHTAASTDFLKLCEAQNTSMRSVADTEELWNNSTVDEMTFEVYQIDRTANSIFFPYSNANYTISANESQLCDNKALHLTAIWDYFQSLKNLSIVQAKADEVKQKLWKQDNFNTSSPCARIAAVYDELDLKDNKQNSSQVLCWAHRVLQIQDYRGYPRRSARYAYELGLGLLTSLLCDSYTEAFKGSSNSTFDYVNESYDRSLTSYFDFFAYGLGYNV